jgi:hypothetical protein
MIYQTNLPPNKTYPIRKALFARVTDVGELVAGVLQVDEQKTEGGKVRTRRYAVQESLIVEGRRFRFRKPLAEQGEDYYVRLTEPGGYDECDCTGFEDEGICTHILALRGIEKANGLISKNHGYLPGHVNSRT